MRDFYAAVQTNANRVSLQGDNSGIVLWDQNDFVTIFSETAEPLKYKVKEGFHGSSETTLTPCDTHFAMSGQAMEPTMKTTILSLKNILNARLQQLLKVQII